MARELDIPLYDEVIRSSEFSDLDYEERLGSRAARRNDMGVGTLKSQEYFTFGMSNSMDYIPLYDEVVKSPEFSELDYEDDIVQEKIPRRVDLGSEPEYTQEKILLNI